MSDSWPEQPGIPPAQNWPPPQPAANAWPPPQMPNYAVPVRPHDDRLVEWAIPINRSGLAIAAGYVALLSLPILFAAPIGVLLGFLALNDIEKNPHKRGKGRAWFAIIYGGIGTAILIYVVWQFFSWPIGGS